MDKYNHKRIIKLGQDMGAWFHYIPICSRTTGKCHSKRREKARIIPLTKAHEIQILQLSYNFVFATVPQFLHVRNSSLPANFSTALLIWVPRSTRWKESSWTISPHFAQYHRNRSQLALFSIRYTFRVCWTILFNYNTDSVCISYWWMRNIAWK